MNPEIFLQLSLAVLFGAIVGFEREYRSKAAGFRTITMITLGATLFTMLSVKLGSNDSHDRIAANIVVGIGFIGAGVIFKDGFGISGLTTAATIWVSSAIGMAIGVKEYLIATVTLVGAIAVLAFFEKVQDWIESIHQVRTYRIFFDRHYAPGKQKVDAELGKSGLAFRVRKILQKGDEASFFYNISGNRKKLDEFAHFLIATQEVKSFDE